MTETNPENNQEAPKNDDDALFAHLRREWPVLFDTHEFKPLKVGIFQDLLNALPDADPKALRRVLGRWCNCRPYRRKLITGTPRTGPDGPCGEVTEAEATHATEQAKKAAAKWRKAAKLKKAAEKAAEASRKAEEAKNAEQEAKAAEKAEKATRAATEASKAATPDKTTPKPTAPTSAPVIVVKKRRTFLPPG